MGLGFQVRSPVRGGTWGRELMNCRMVKGRLPRILWPGPELLVLGLSRIAEAVAAAC